MFVIDRFKTFSGCTSADSGGGRAYSWLPLEARSRPVDRVATIVFIGSTIWVFNVGEATFTKLGHIAVQGAIRFVRNVMHNINETIST